uniref:ATP synthase F0 subunit b n=1 Tax=Antithamnionella miharai TaxID=536589 RepID=UPI002E761957|nr:ATP synthase F0 subunit b [Antithamnionella miharai]WQF69339.1 ATP synthase F0 subunit b [Antithamnionella miharai]WQF69364.1 ATP synthase F0 subunit b [Antithamnionella miharai]
MVNFSVLFFLLLILVNTKFILLNEETLILICFITFCWLGSIKLNNAINNYFKLQQSSIKFKIQNSFVQNLNDLNNLITHNNKNRIWNLKFLELKNHFLEFSKDFVQLFPSFCQANFQNNIFKKLIFTKRLEQQMIKLISLVLIEKLHKIIVIQKFLETTLQFKPIFTIKKIALREYFKKIY